MKRLVKWILLFSIFFFSASQSPADSSRADEAWLKIWGKAGSVVEGAETFATDQATGDIYIYRGIAGKKWEKIGGPGKKFVTVGKVLYGLAPDKSGVFSFTGSSGSWTKIRGSTGDIYGGPGGMFATDPTSGDIYAYKSFLAGVYKAGWTKIGGPGKTFAVGGQKGELAAAVRYLYGLAPDGLSVWKFNFLTIKWSNIGGPSPVNNIYAGSDKLYATNSQTGDIYEYDASSGKWTKIGGPGKQFTVGPETGTLYSLSPDGSEIFKYLGSAGKWIKIGGGADTIQAGIGDRLYAIGPVTHDLWSFSLNPFGAIFYELKPVSGSRNVLALLWDPKRPAHPAPSKTSVENAIFGTYPSAWDFFRENSFKQLNLVNAGVLGWYAADHSADHYWAALDQEDLPEDRNGNGLLDTGEDLNNNGELDGPDGILQTDEDKNGNGKLDYDLDKDGWISGHVEKWAEAIRKADAQFDFKKYDADKDGTLSSDELTILIVIPQNDVFGTQRGVVGKEVPTEDLVVDGVIVDTMIEAYVGTPGSAETLGVLTHELSHILLNTPDMYFDFYQPYAAGPYSLMDWDPSHLDPFHKLKLGWGITRIIPKDEAAGYYQIPDIETHHELFVLEDPTHGYDEYFILENRWKGSSYDSLQTAAVSGLAVWHIIENKSVFGNLAAPTGVDAAQWSDVAAEDWGRRAIRMIRPILGPPINWALWDGSSSQTGYELSLNWADGSASGFTIAAIPKAGKTMTVQIKIK